MIKIRLSRGGTKKRPVYKVVIADSRRARDGRFIEKVGFFNPLLPKDKKERVGLEAERIKYWLGQGAQPTTRVARILGENGIIAMPANGSNPSKAIPKKERKKEGDEAAPAAEAPKEEAPKAEAAPAAEAPKEEAPKAEAAPAAEAPKEEAPKAEAAPAAEAPKEEAPKAEAAPAAEAPKEEAPKAEAAPAAEAPKEEAK
ncbi:30S ribosomal protein S16 [Candidatus Pelagibacter ubique]|nr:30S ribosomal protein S16 [Candidatus Pelagibacter ubique]